MNPRTLETFKKRLAEKLDCDPEDLITRQDVADVYDVTIHTVKAWSARCVGPRYHVEGSISLYLVEDLLKWENNCPLKNVGIRAKQISEKE